MVDCSVVESAVVAGAAAAVVEEEVASSGTAEDDDEDEEDEEESSESAATAEPTPMGAAPELEPDEDEADGEAAADEEDSEDESSELESEPESELPLSREAGWSDRPKMELISSGVTEGVDEAGDAEAEEAELEGTLDTVQACSCLPPPVLVSSYTYPRSYTG